MATAVLLINVQNEFASPVGKLNCKVSDVMEKTGIMAKLPEFVNTARNNGAIIVYAPMVTKQTGGEEAAEALLGIATFEEGSFGSEIVDELKPERDDIILAGRADFSAFHGTNLLSIIKEKKIHRIFVAGFTTNLSILETVREATNLGLFDADGKRKLEMSVIGDCCAAESLDEHSNAILFSIRTHCKTCSYNQATNMLTDDGSPESEAPRRSPTVPVFSSLLPDGQSDLDLDESLRSITGEIPSQKKRLTIKYESLNIRKTREIFKFLMNGEWILPLSDCIGYIMLSLFMQLVIGHDYAFPQGKPSQGQGSACGDDSQEIGGPNFAVCHLESVLESNVTALRTLVAFVLGGFITNTVFLWRTRRTNYCTLCCAIRNLIIQISSLIPIPSDPNDEAYEDIIQERQTMERWALLGFELAVLKGKGIEDAQAGKAHLESLGLLVADEWEKMAAGNRHTAVWYWLQQKAVHLTEHGIITSEHRLQTLCNAIFNSKVHANDLMSVIARDNPAAYSFMVGLMVNLNMLIRSVWKGVQWGIWFYDAKWRVYLLPSMWADLTLSFIIIFTFTMLYDVGHVLYNPFIERDNFDDVPHRIVGAGIRNLANHLGEGTDSVPSSMYWMKSQEKDRKRMGLRFRPQRAAMNKRTRSSEADRSALQEYIRFNQTTTSFSTSVADFKLQEQTKSKKKEEPLLDIDFLGTIEE